MTPQRKLMTPQRKVIWQIVTAKKWHPTADEVYHLARKKLPSISLGTVYRNLSQLVEAGKLKKVERAGEASRFDAEIEEHFHVRCTGCGKLADVPAEISETMLERARGASGYEITGYDLDFTGLCPECKQRAS